MPCEISIDYQISKADAFSIITLLGCVKNPVVVVELGCWVGSSTIALGMFGRAMGVEKFYTVDNFKGEDVYSMKNEVILPRKILEDNLKAIGLSDFVIIIDSDSSKAASLFDDDSIDFLFIDADHKYSGINKDLVAWYPKVKESGIFCGHDFEGLGWDERYIEEDYVEGRHHGVIKAVQNIFGRVNWLPDKVWWANKSNELVTPVRVPNMSAVSALEYNKGEVL